MTGSRRILTVFGTRPEAIKLFPLVHALERDPRFVSRTCSSGQHRELLDPVLALAGIIPDHDLALMRPGQALEGLTAALLVGLGTVLDAERPDWVVVQGDTATALAATAAAWLRGIPVAHVEAGLRSGDIAHPWPEEINRTLVGAVATLHCAPTTGAAEALRGEGVDPRTIHVAGNTVIDALHWMRARLAREPGLAGGLDELAHRYSGKRVIAVTLHRRENLGELSAVAEAIRYLAARSDVAVIFPVHPNPEVRSAVEPVLSGLANVAMTPPLDYPHFARLLGLAHVVLTDSGGVQEEAPALGVPVLVARQTTERPEGVAAGTARLVGTDTARIVAEATRLLDDDTAHAAMARAHNPYGDGRSAARIVELLAAATA
ncbi:MAG: UDP-N-acetylglucosamine 2-epimerase (non-hydrolyzing) [Croceibacterium sp.]